MIHRLRRVVLRVFGHLLPRTAARWFERAVLTPRPVRPPAGAEFPSDGTSMRIPYGNGWLAIHVWGAGPTVVLAHGWGGSARSMGAWIGPLRDAGYRVVAFDAPAHGASDGKRTNIVECAGAMLQIGRAFGPLHAVVAHSFGGPVTLLASRFGLQYERLVLLGPPRSIYDQTLEIGDLVGLPRHVSERMVQGVADRLRIEWRSLFSDHMAAAVDAPLLVVHDEGDRMVPFVAGEAIARAAPRGMLIKTRGLGHRGTLTDPQVLERARDFLRHPDVRTARISA